MPFDPKNKADKAKLYPVLKALAEMDPRKTPELIMDDAVGQPVARGQDYVRNMRRGEIATTYATLIHQWLTEHHFEPPRVYRRLKHSKGEPYDEETTYPRLSCRAA